MIKEPSSRTIILFLITLFIVVMVIGISIYREKSAQTTALTEQESNISLAVGELSNGIDDADSDGLRDWEEDLWGSDKNNPDTDADGTLDGQEIKEGRDPTVPAPGDEVSAVDAKRSLLLSQQSVYKDFKAGSLTDLLAQDLFISYAGLKQENILGTESQDAVISDLAAQAQGQLNFIGPYTSAELKVFTDENPTALKNYGNTFGQAQLRFLVNLEAVDETDPTNPLARIYRQHADKLMTLDVPRSQKERHVSIANQYYVMSQIMENLLAYKEDPVKALLSIQQYQKTQEELGVFYSIIKTFFRDNGIIFNDNEPGSLLW